MVLPDTYIDHDSPDRQIALAGIDADAITAKALSLVGTAEARLAVSRRA